MKILIHIPTKGDKNQFFTNYFKYKALVKNFEETAFSISLDIKDQEMNNKHVLGCLDKEPNLSYIVSDNRDKVEAINNIAGSGEWDILVYSHTDMQPLVSNYDGYIRDRMRQEYPDLDGVIVFKDEAVCIGRKYYDRYKYIFNPKFIETSHFYLRNFVDKADGLGKITFFDAQLFGHANQSSQQGRMMPSTEYHQDKNTFFDLKKLS